MCWRDDVRTRRYCFICGNSYYGSLGHFGCPGRKKKDEPQSPRDVNSIVKQANEIERKKKTTN